MYTKSLLNWEAFIAALDEVQRKSSLMLLYEFLTPQMDKEREALLKPATPKYDQESVTRKSKWKYSNPSKLKTQSIMVWK